MMIKKACESIRKKMHTQFRPNRHAVKTIQKHNSLLCFYFTSNKRKLIRGIITDF